MANNGWAWANLNGSQMELLRKGEDTLGADILLAYQQSGAPEVEKGVITRSKIQPAMLNDSQLECLQGLENQLHAVVVAYQRS